MNRGSERSSGETGSVSSGTTSDHSALLKSLEDVVMDLNDMENMIEDFDDGNANLFFEKINTYIESLQEVEKQQGSCHLQIPVESLERLDNEYEQNPEFFSQELMQRCRNQSGQLGTRVQGIKLVNETIAKGWPGGAMPVGVVAAGGAEGETVKAPSGVARPGSKVVGVHPGAQRRVLPRMDENGTRGS